MLNICRRSSDQIPVLFMWTNTVRISEILFAIPDRVLPKSNHCFQMGNFPSCTSSTEMIFVQTSLQISQRIKSNMIFEYYTYCHTQFSEVFEGANVVNGNISNATWMFTLFILYFFFNKSRYISTSKWDKLLKSFLIDSLRLSDTYMHQHTIIGSDNGLSSGQHHTFPFK